MEDNQEIVDIKTSPTSQKEQLERLASDHVSVDIVSSSASFKAVKVCVGNGRFYGSNLKLEIPWSQWSIPFTIFKLYCTRA